MRIGFAQLNPTVGDLAGNTRKILAAYETLCAQGAELVLTPELAICGYPPQDLVFKSRFVPLMLERLAELHAAVGEVPLLVGYVDVNDGPGQPFRNAVALLHDNLHQQPSNQRQACNRQRSPRPGAAPRGSATVTFSARTLLYRDAWG